VDEDRRPDTDDLHIYRPVPVDGQWWGLFSPMCLARVKYGGTSTVVFEVWHPFALQEEACFLNPIPGEPLLYQNEYPAGDLHWRLGQVYLAEGKGRLFFIGPTSATVVTTLAAWDLDAWVRPQDNWTLSIKLVQDSMTDERRCAMERIAGNDDPV
jgi:hypothetical protein